MNCKKKNILLIGAGQLGSRHLQSLATLPREEYNIFVVEPSIESQKISQQRLIEVDALNGPFVNFYNSIDHLIEKDFFACIVATSAAVRLNVLNILLNSFKVNFLILEKVLFQSIEQLEKAKELINFHNVKTWVNCPRRQFDGYKKLSSRLKQYESVSIEVIGNSWGLACNSIHFIDLWEFLTDFEECNLFFSSDSFSLTSKRDGFLEVIGQLNGSSICKKHNISLICKNDSSTDSELHIKIYADRDLYTAKETHGEIVYKAGNCPEEKFSDLNCKYQSQLTCEVVQSLASNADCELTPFDVSTKLHLPFFEAISKVFEPNNSDIRHIILPIT